jgi:hypothetical protein
MNMAVEMDRIVEKTVPFEDRVMEQDESAFLMDEQVSLFQNLSFHFFRPSSRPFLISEKLGGRS